MHYSIDQMKKTMQNNTRDYDFADVYQKYNNVVGN